MFNQAAQPATETYDPYATAAVAGAVAGTTQPAPEAPATPEAVTSEPTDATAEAKPTTKKCPKCNFDNSADSKFCSNCGNQL